MLKKFKISFSVFFLLIISSAVFSQKNNLPSIPVGEWSYLIMMNGTKIGTALLTNKLEKNLYISTSEMKIKINQIINISSQIITETTDYQPVKIETNNKIINQKKIQSSQSIALIKNKKINLTVNGSPSTFSIKQPFVFDGNYFTAELLKKKFKKGLELKAFLYDPSIEIEKPFAVTVKVLGPEKIILDNKKVELIHLKQSIENIKTIDSYVNQKGILQKATIQMANNKIELLKI